MATGTGVGTYIGASYVYGVLRQQTAMITGQFPVEYICEEECYGSQILAW